MIGDGLCPYARFLGIKRVSFFNGSVNGCSLQATFGAHCVNEDGGSFVHGGHVASVFDEAARQLIVHLYGGGVTLTGTVQYVKTVRVRRPVMVVLEERVGGFIGTLKDERGHILATYSGVWKQRPPKGTS